MKKNVQKILLPVVICAAMFAGCGEKEAAIESTESLATEAVAEATEEVAATEEIVAETETEEIVEATESEPETEQDSETKSSKKDKSQVSDENKETAANSEQSETAAANESAPAGSESTAAASESAPAGSENAVAASDASNASSNNASNGEVVYSGSVSLSSLGITIVCPNQYVSGGFYADDILNNANAFTNAFNNKYGTRAQGMTWNGNAYGFYFAGYNATPETQIKYNGDGTYTLIIGAHFGGGYHATNSGNDYTSIVADAILCELSTMSSTPQSVYNGVYDMFYGTTIYDAGTWYTFGDCKVSYSSNGTCEENVVSMVLTLKKA